MSERVPWGKLNRHQKEEFAELCDQFVGLDTVEDAEKYYGNREKLIEDAQEATK